MAPDDDGELAASVDVELVLAGLTALAFIRLRAMEASLRFRVSSMVMFLSLDFC